MNNVIDDWNKDCVSFLLFLQPYRKKVKIFEVVDFRKHLTGGWRVDAAVLVRICCFSDSVMNKV